MSVIRALVVLPGAPECPCILDFGGSGGRKSYKFVMLDIIIFIIAGLPSGGSKTTRLEGRNLLFYFRL
jgi:hypothetical protein